MFQADVIAEVSGLVKAGRGLSVFLIIAGFSFLLTRRGRAGMERTGPSNYVGGNYIVLLYLRWALLAIGCLGVLLLIVGSLT
jgi:hypothetical protein